MAYFADRLRLHDRAQMWPQPGPTPYHHLADLLKLFPCNSNRDVFAIYETNIAQCLPSPELISVFNDLEILLPSLLDPAVSALIIARDRGIPPIRQALHRIGTRIPDDLSAISYDNDVHYAHHGISSVDPGADDLGHQAFHVIERDIPMRFPYGRNKIVARPWIADRYSVRAVS